MKTKRVGYRAFRKLTPERIAAVKDTIATLRSDKPINVDFIIALTREHLGLTEQGLDRLDQIYFAPTKSGIGWDINRLAAADWLEARLNTALAEQERNALRKADARMGVTPGRTVHWN